MERVLVAVVMLVTGCAVPPPVEEMEAVSPELAMLPVGATGGEVVLEPGAQGGFHVWMAFRAAGMQPGRVSLVRRARRLSDGKGVLNLTQPAEVGAEGSGGPVPMFMCPSPIGLSVIDAPIVFELRVFEGADEKAHGEVTLTPRCPEGEQRAFCERICTG